MINKKLLGRVMKKNLLLVFFTILILVAGCSAEQYGAGVNKSVPSVKIKDVILNPSYVNQVVNLEGIIVSQCLSNGCWLFLNDGTGQIFVDMAPHGFSLPSRPGKKAKVTGLVVQGQNGLQITAHGIEVN